MMRDGARYRAGSLAFAVALLSFVSGAAGAEKPLQFSGVYPHLAVYSNYGECGIGALVPWAGKLWFLTYPPHFPQGSEDKLYTLDENLRLEVRPESIGGTHAGRMIHDESRQLIIGPYFIDEKGNVRAVDVRSVRGRITAVTRHLTDPANKVYLVGMERELYEVDVRTLAAARIYGENQGPFPGTHGKGAAVAQGRLVIANNGEGGWSISKDPHFNGPVGCLAETDGRDWTRPWRLVQRAPFCEVTGPGGLHGQAGADQRLWATGWDKRSVILKLLEAGTWHTYRLPKASSTHDAFHGWFTEWPRIREIIDGHWLMHMHGMFYDFPPGFSAVNTAGLRPISTYLKMPVDYCAWQGRIVMARDDTSIMQNPLAGQSHSNLWFGSFADLERYGAPAGWGGPWVDDAVRANEPSDPFLVAGFSRGVLWLSHDCDAAVRFTLEADRDGRGQWNPLTGTLGDIGVERGRRRMVPLGSALGARWLRIRTDRDVKAVTAWFCLGNPPRQADPDLTRSLAAIESGGAMCGGIIKPADKDARTLLFGANIIGPSGKLPQSRLYSMDGRLMLQLLENPDREKILRSRYGVSGPDFSVDAASVIVSEGGRRWRLPKTDPAYDAQFAGGWLRGRREVVTERDLFNAHGTFYEVPRASSGGFQKMRPICTHRKRITDFCSWRGMLVLAGVGAGTADDPHVIRSADRAAALWFGEVDDLWRFGPPVGVGGPWKESRVAAGVPSDPYLMTGYDRKTLTITHDANGTVEFVIELDVLGDGRWMAYEKLAVEVGRSYRYVFADGLSARWVRLMPRRDTRVTAIFDYTIQP